MAFPQSVADRALAACGRCCCICHKFCGVKMELHHIHQHADGGEDTFENCIPLCFDCHAEMGKGDPHHPKGKRYSEQELRLHRDNWYARNEPTNGQGSSSLHTTQGITPHAIVLSYENSAFSGTFTFDYSNNNGQYIIGTGEYQFVTRWSKASDVCIHAYKDSLGQNGAIARVKQASTWPEQINEEMDFSSRVRTPDIGDVIVWKNSFGKYAATKILAIADDTRGAEHDELTCEYVIYNDQPQSNVVSATMRNAAGGHTVIIDDEKYIAKRILEEHDREIERMLKEI